MRLFAALLLLAATMAGCAGGGDEVPAAPVEWTGAAVDGILDCTTDERFETSLTTRPGRVGPTPLEQHLIKR